MMSRGSGNSRGVTILEVLIVMGIIFIISALSVPVYHSVIIKIRRTRMLSQLKMMTDDQALYQRDHGTFYPSGTKSGNTITAFEVYPPWEPMLLEGQSATLPAGTRHYTYYIYRNEPASPEPIIYAYAHHLWRNDLDGDVYPDLWIKIGSAPAQPYLDDLTDTMYHVPPF